jgi:DegV family protein with EDD domain
MTSFCIVTDSTAQIPQTSLWGKGNIKVVQIPLSYKGIDYEDEKQVEQLLPYTANNDLKPHLLAPSPEKFRKIFNELGKEFDQIYGIFLSSQLNPCCGNAQEAALSLKGRINVQVIDSQTTSAGLGYLVQWAAEAGGRGVSINEIDRHIRSILPSIYTILCTPGLSYLFYNGFIDQAQAYVGEMLGFFPIFTMEEGRLVPLEKVKTQRHATNFLLEFLDEFENLYYIVALQNTSSTLLETRGLREHSHDRYPKTPFCELPINTPTSMMLGPGSFGLIVIENQNHKN